MSQGGEYIAQGAGFGATAHGVGAFRLGQLAAVAVDHQRQMHPGRRRVIKRLVERYLPAGGIQQVVAAHHLGDAGGKVVDNHRKLVGNQAIGATNHEIADRVPNT